MHHMIGKVASTATFLVLAAPTWWFVVLSAAAPRTSDNGVFLSVAAAVADGAPLYVDVVDNKDPLFFYALAGALKFGPGAAQLLDVVWLLLAAGGSFLLARSVTKAIPALFAGFVATPLVILGIAYQPGMTNLPGTSLTLLGMGLLVSRAWWAAGVVLALSVAAKITVAPIAVGVLVAAMLVPHMRPRALRSIAVFVISLGALVAALWAVGSLGGYLAVLSDNFRYSGDVMVYFGLSPDFLGHLERLNPDMRSDRWVSGGSILVIAFAALALWWFGSERLTVLVVWLWMAILGTFAALALTYVWPHHWQMVALPAVTALVVACGLGMWVLGDGKSGSVVSVLVALALTLPLGGWIPIQRLPATFHTERAEWTQWRSQLADRTLESKLLETVPLPSFSVARLGTNDDAAFLLNLPPPASLACPRFHLYDFSPAADFEEARACLDRADVVIVTDQFLTFQNGWRSASVAPIASQINEEFFCLRVNDRQVCTRR
ncbi:hypothetical protein N9E04_00190 [bacterium]|nr:hypothetical protein [bacterium]